MKNFERTLVLIKPDGVERGLIGEVIRRFERVGLKLVAIKMLKPGREQVDRHYALTEEWMKGVFNKAKTKYDERGEKFPYTDHVSYGTHIKDGLVEFLCSAPIVAMVWEGEQSVALVRKLAGTTEPAGAAPGTIRGDLSLDSYTLSNGQERPIRNIVHASGAVAEADHEIAVWFTESEIVSYAHVNDPVLYDAKRFK
jgi:nucleoside-diphosphate kinase